MSVTRLYAETPCEQCDDFHSPTVANPKGRWAGLACLGSGGGRRLIEIDYEAAKVTFERMMDSDSEGADWNTEEYVHHIVGAALGSVNPQ